MITELHCGDYHTLLVSDTGAVYFSGSTNHGKSGLRDSLFDEVNIIEFTPVPLPFSGKIKQASASTGHNWLLDNEGKLWCVGANNLGQLGLGEAPEASAKLRYTQVNTLPLPVQFVASNRGHTLVVLIDGSLWATGCSENGQLGLVTTENQYRFTQVTQLPADKTITLVAVRDCGSFLVFDDGSLWAAGSNEDYCLGLPEPVDYHVFTPVVQNMLGKRVIQIVSGLTMTALLLDDGQVMVTGNNVGGHYGLLGLGHRHPINAFTRVETLPVGRRAKFLTSGRSFIQALLDDNSIWGSGENIYGQLGIDKTITDTFVGSFTPARFSTKGSPIQCMAAGGDFTLLLLTNGQLWGIGNNQMGALGLGYINNTQDYLQIPFLTKSRLPAAEKDATLQDKSLKIYRQQLTISVHAPDAFSKIASQINGRLASTIFMPQFFGCHLCSRYVKPTLWGECALHSQERRPAVKTGASVLAQVQPTVDVDVLLSQSNELARQRHYQEALSLLRQAAAQGDADACNAIGLYYDKGLWVNEDKRQAFVWYKKGAELGLDAAQYNVGVCFEMGNGTTQDYQQAFIWYQKAAKQGYVNAQYSLGTFYENGTGVSQDYTQAFAWYQKAAAQGDIDAQYSLATCFEKGLGVAANIQQAMFWYQKVAEQGDNYARGALIRLRMSS